MCVCLSLVFCELSVLSSSPLVGSSSSSSSSLPLPPYAALAPLHPLTHPFYFPSPSSLHPPCWVRKLCIILCVVSVLERFLLGRSHRFYGFFRFGRLRGFFVGFEKPTALTSPWPSWPGLAISRRSALPRIAIPPPLAPPWPRTFSTVDRYVFTRTFSTSTVTYHRHRHRLDQYVIVLSRSTPTATTIILISNTMPLLPSSIRT